MVWPVWYSPRDENTLELRIQNMKRVLVTGGAGYIGSHVCKLLAENGIEPVVYDSLEYGHDWAVQWGPLEQGLIHDEAKLAKVFARYQPEAVLHFAAYIAVGESVVDPLRYYQNNVDGSLSLLRVATEHSVDKFVFSSTAAVYGMPESVPMTESHRLQPINPYGHSKLMVERMLQDLEVAGLCRSVALRYFNAAGADAEGQTGEAHEPETHLIPLVLEAALGLREYITVFGDDYDTADGTCIRDYIHVTDLAQAHLDALRYLEHGGASTALNLGNGNGFSVREIIDCVERVTGRQVPVKMGPRRDGDPAVLIADASAAREKLGWTPAYAELETIVETAWQWLQKQSRE